MRRDHGSSRLLQVALEEISLHRRGMQGREGELNANASRCYACLPSTRTLLHSSTKHGLTNYVGAWCYNQVTLLSLRALLRGEIRCQCGVIKAGADHGRLEFLCRACGQCNRHFPASCASVRDTSAAQAGSKVHQRIEIHVPCQPARVLLLVVLVA